MIRLPRTAGPGEIALVAVLAILAACLLAFLAFGAPR